MFLLVWYPNLTGLPLPSGLATAFQGLLPTWTYDFSSRSTGGSRSRAASWTSRRWWWPWPPRSTSRS
ncbi:MAG: hypothetical protein R3C32_04390 [Chloroflexota bacterium]